MAYNQQQPCCIIEGSPSETNERFAMLYEFSPACKQVLTID